MKVIERYILRRTTLWFLASLIWTLTIVWTTQVLTRINLVTDSGQSALAFFEIAGLILPSIFPLVVPFAVAIAVAYTLTVMNTDSELVVISASGSSRSATIRPVMILAILAALVSFAVHNGVDPYARQRGRELVANARADLLSMVIQEGTFRKIEEGLFIQIGERLQNGRLGGIFVVDSREEGVDLVYYAKTGEVVEREGKNVLVMDDGEIDRKQLSGDISIIRFTSYAFDLSAFSSAANGTVSQPKDRTLGYLLNPDPNDWMLKDRPQLFRAELHKRFTEWLYPIVFALIALSVTGDARSYREARLHPLVTTLVICLFVRWLGFFVFGQNQSVAWFWPFVYIVPFGAATIAIWFIAINRSLELPMSFAERVGSALRRIADRLMFASLWRKSHSGGSS